MLEVAKTWNEFRWLAQDINGGSLSAPMLCGLVVELEGPFSGTQGKRTRGRPRNTI